MARFLPIGFLAILITLVLTPVIKRIAIRIGLVEYPDERRVHTAPLPLGGGVGIYISFWLTIFLSGNWTSHLIGILLASTIILLTGLIDDKWQLSPALKLAGQLLASIVLVISGTQIQYVTNPFGGMVHLAVWGIPITLLWLVSITNIVNFIDGLDGLAAGVVVIACAPMVGIALLMEQPFAAMLAIVLAGSVLGFLPYNFNPARIIMGDSGALFLGFVLGAISIEGALKGPTAIALAVPILALGLPIIDTVFAVVRRFRAGRPVYEADKGHVHHRLLAIGYTQRQAVVLLYALSGVLGAAALMLLGLRVGHALLFVGVVVTGTILTGRYLRWQTTKGRS